MTDAADIPRGMSRTPLPAPPPPDAEMLRLVEAMLDKRPIPPELQALMTDPAAIAERRDREARLHADDWPALARYRLANARVDRPELVLIGDSITEIWQFAMPGMFGTTIVNRGISGQTSPQILLRFMADVVDLRPRAVHILCGTNDIAGNTGPNTPEDFQRNIRAMVEIATGHGIELLLASIPPARSIFWQPEARPGEWIAHLNEWLRGFCTTRGLRFVDYHTALADHDGALQDRYSADGVHVTRAAYRAMAEILTEAVRSLPTRKV